MMVSHLVYAALSESLVLTGLAYLESLRAENGAVLRESPQRQHVVDVEIQANLQQGDNLVVVEPLSYSKGTADGVMLK